VQPLRFPLVNLSSSLQDSRTPRVRVDERTCGVMAAQHLVACGFSRFAYYGFAPAWYSAERGKGFSDTLEAAGHTCLSAASATSLDGRDRGKDEWKKLEAWLRTIPPPFGLMACSDQWAVAAMEACHEIGLKVPDDVAIIGVNNDEITCEYCRPKLTSVIRPDHEIGYQAAALLDQLMAGKAPRQMERVLAPVGVEKRGSTDVLAAENDYVRKAALFIREHVGEGIGVQEVLDHASGSRRLLEYRFREHLGRTPYQYICEIRVERAKQLLETPGKMRLKEISQACGFHDLQRFRLVFERLAGLSPRQYRIKAAANPPLPNGGAPTPDS
jgi:LacI family transcriptional regulator